jgi:hypothetical protein
MEIVRQAPKGDPVTPGLGAPCGTYGRVDNWPRRLASAALPPRQLRVVAPFIEPKLLAFPKG